jgi:CubicO group peptidase (beta-lactamase class C family)
MRATHRWARRVAIGAFAPAAAFAQAATPALPPGLDAYIASVLKEFQVPGVAVAVVKDGKVIVAQGYGVRRLGDTAHVSPRTLFGIASNTKAFTATALALLVEEGKLDWDAPVVNFLPAFALYDPFVTRELTIKDLLVHRSGLGLGAGDLLWWPTSTYSRAEIAGRLRYIKPATSFRSAYAYDNVLYLVASQVIEAVSGKSWEDFVTTRLLQPVGMTTSGVRLSGSAAAATGADVATTHAEIEGKVRPIAPFTSDNTNPAGGIMSNAQDMAKWVIAQLDSGRVGEKRLWSQRSARMLWTGVTPTPIGTPPPELRHMQASFNAYALGFNTRDYRGRKMVQHSGGLPGYVSLVTMIPDLKLGVVVLTNMEAGLAFNAITYRIVDHYMGAQAPDYLGVYRAQAARARTQLLQTNQQAAAQRNTTSKPSLPPGKYAGTYVDAWYGDVTIAEESGKLVMRFTRTPSLVGDLEHWQYDTFVVRWRDRELRADAYVTFTLNPDASISEARMAPASPDVDFSFDFQDLLLKPKAAPR